MTQQTAPPRPTVAVEVWVQRNERFQPEGVACYQTAFPDEIDVARECFETDTPTFAEFIDACDPWTVEINVPADQASSPSFYFSNDDEFEAARADMAAEPSPPAMPSPSSPIPPQAGHTDRGMDR